MAELDIGDRAKSIMAFAKGIRASGIIPKHLKDAHYKGAEKLGHGNEYKFPHAYPNHWVAQQYMPDTLVGRRYYEAGDTGNYERALAENRRKREGK